MFWIYALVGTAGIVCLVPTIMRALAGLDTSIVEGAIGFGGVVFAVSGLIGMRFTELSWLNLLAAVALATAAAVIHPEIITGLRSDDDRNQRAANAKASPPATSTS